MDKQQKIQAAIDALPHATGGDWGVDLSRNIRTPISTTEKHIAMVNFNHSGDSRDVSGEEHSANAKIIAAAKDLAEEAVRLRASTLQGQVERLDTKAGDVVVVRVPGMRPADAPELARMLEAWFPENVSALVLVDGQSAEVRRPSVEEPDLNYCTIRDDFDGIGDDPSGWSLECRFSDGQKYGAVTIDRPFEKLAIRIMDFLNGGHS